MGPRLTVVTLSLFVGLGPALWAANWPSWRGPNNNGISDEKNLPLQWSPSDNIRWKIPMPDRTGATPIVWNDRIFLNLAEGTELYLWCVDRTDGKVLWKQHLGGGNKRMRKQNMSSPSPVTDGAHVWALTGTGVLKAFDFDGNEVWGRDIQREYGEFGLNWGYASSPLLHEGALYLQVLHGMKTDDPSYILKIQAKSGHTRWKVERPTDALMESPDAYTTPALLQQNGETEIIISGGDYVTGHDPETGKELWRAGGLNPDRDRFYRTVASPTVMDGMIYACSRVRPLLALRVGGRGDITQTHKVWSTSNGPDVPTPVTDGKYIFILSDKGIMFCLDAKTGKELWGNQRVQPGTYSASPLLADGRIYVTSEDGMTTVIEAGPTFKILSENNLDEYTLSSLAISDGQIFLRTANHLYCIGTRRGGD